ncbi:hypothetical protein GOOTI_039_00010, partial [Gordonia otitidis NBRC 100426]
MRASVFVTRGGTDVDAAAALKAPGRAVGVDVELSDDPLINHVATTTSPITTSAAAESTACRRRCVTVCLRADISRP